MLDVYEFHTNPEELVGWNRRVSQQYPSTDDMLGLLEDQMYDGDYFDVDYDVKPLGRSAIAITLSLNGVDIWGKIEYNEKSGIIRAALEHNDAAIHVNDNRFEDLDAVVKSICQSFSDIAKDQAGMGG